MTLSDAERVRYSRHLRLAEFGEDGQARLKAARVLIVGAGGLGSPAALYLAAAGVGTVGLVDFDTVDESNLQRQILYGTADVGRPKLVAAAARLSDTNPHVTIACVDEPFSAANALALVGAYDVVIDGTDNFATRYLVNDACVMTRTPNVYGSVSRFEGQAAVFASPGGPCYRCLHPDPPPPGLIENCAEGGVLGVLPGLIGTIQATEAIKIVTGIGTPLVGRLLLYDALAMRVRTIALPRNPDCPVCGDSPTIRDLVAYEPPPCAPVPGGEMTVTELRAWRDRGEPHVLVDVREPSEHAASRIDGSILIPLGSLASALDRLPAGGPVVVHCKSGRRSARAVALLRSCGYDARNLVGGIDAWSAIQRAAPDVSRDIKSL
ncbi:MAG TPA: molybdopterin-synthase adenylyltransferase MoeB [Vicinamibacterales bacterium]|nr:molybdopterin-synthase adenylyltransferase MoeB [Vicinamibacterales bacterium]